MRPFSSLFANTFNKSINHFTELVCSRFFTRFYKSTKDPLLFLVV
ncbi:MAG: hypothetical protein ACI976_002398 [Aureispira sp.]